MNLSVASSLLALASPAPISTCFDQIPPAMSNSAHTPVASVAGGIAKPPTSNATGNTLQAQARPSDGSVSRTAGASPEAGLSPTSHASLPQNQPSFSASAPTSSEQSAAPSVASAEASTPPNQTAPEYELKGFLVIPHLGLLVAGNGAMSRQCDASNCPDGLDGVAGYAHEKAILISADFLWQLGPYFRIGPSIQYTIASDLDPDTSTEPKYEIGPMAGLDFVAELSARVGPTSWLVPRVQLGLMLVDPQGDLDNTLTATQALCESAETIDNCDSLDGARVGIEFGLGFGGLFALSDTVRLRADGLAQLYSLRLYKLHDAAQDQDLSLTATGARFMLLGGMEF